MNTRIQIEQTRQYRSGFTCRVHSGVSVPPLVRVVTDAWSLVMDGEMTMTEWLPLIVEAIELRLDTKRTATKATTEVNHLFRNLKSSGAVGLEDVTPSMVQDWMWAAWSDRSGRHRSTAQSTARNRQWVARLAFEAAASMGAPIDVAILIGGRIARPTDFISARPLTDDEAHQVRVFADAGHVASRRSLLVAFSFAGGSATEVAAVRSKDVDTASATVTFSGAAARDGRLDGWGVETVDRYFRNSPSVGADDLLCVTPTISPERAAHSVSVRLGQVLRDAGISGLYGVSARSIRLTTALKILQADGIEAAARFLGSPSLDNTATALNYGWRQCDV